MACHFFWIDDDLCRIDIKMASKKMYIKINRFLCVAVFNFNSARMKILISIDKVRHKIIYSYSISYPRVAEKKIVIMQLQYKIFYFYSREKIAIYFLYFFIISIVALLFMILVNLLCVIYMIFHFYCNLAWEMSGGLKLMWNKSGCKGVDHVNFYIYFGSHLFILMPLSTSLYFYRWCTCYCSIALDCCERWWTNNINDMGITFKLGHM